MEAQEQQNGIYKLGIAMSRRLRQELSNWGKIKFQKGILLLTLSAKQIENELGWLLKKVHEIIDRHFPNRPADIPLSTIDDSNMCWLKLKIWHTGPVV